MTKVAAKTVANDIYMDAGEVARTLGISLPTLYAYVSRKKIRTHRPAGQKTSQYLREDVEQIKAKNSRFPQRSFLPGLVTSSSITLLAESGSFYRGTSTIELSKTATVEDVARLLWQTERDPFAEPADAAPPNWDRFLALVEGFAPLDRVAALIPVLEAANSKAYDLSRQAFTQNSASLLRWIYAIIFGEQRASDLPLHQFVGATTGCGPELEDIVRRVLVLSADHGLEPTTYAVRAIANTGATPHRCILGGLSAAGGSRQAAVRSAAFFQFVDEIDEAVDPVTPIRRRLAENEEIPGFGFTPFPLVDSDPRATAIRASMKRILQSDKRYLKFDRSISIAEDMLQTHADYTLQLIWLSSRLGMPKPFSLVRLARFVGWLAHAMEQQEQPLIKWKAHYTGPLP